MKNKELTIAIVAGFFILLSCSSKVKTNQNKDLSIDSMKALILTRENATLKRWYNGDPMGFIDNAWEDVTYFDPSLVNRVDSIDTFRKFLTPVTGLIHIPEHKFDKPLVQVFGDIAILTFTDVFTIDTTTSRWHATEIYLCRENEWKLIHSHWTESKAK